MGFDLDFDPCIFFLGIRSRFSFGFCFFLAFESIVPFFLGLGIYRVLVRVLMMAEAVDDGVFWGGARWSCIECGGTRGASGGSVNG